MTLGKMWSSLLGLNKVFGDPAEVATEMIKNADSVTAQFENVLKDSLPKGYHFSRNPRLPCIGYVVSDRSLKYFFSMSAPIYIDGMHPFFGYEYKDKHCDVKYCDPNYEKVAASIADSLKPLFSEVRVRSEVA
jgi:hypothetical protein